MIPNLKRIFMGYADEVCPGFRVTSDNRQVLSAVFNWSIGANASLAPSKGLWFYGNIGSGKTTLLRVARRFCREMRAPGDNGRPYTFAIVSMSQVVTAFSEKSYSGLNELADIPVAAFDDVGTETMSAVHYGSHENPFQYILQRRYDKNLPTHATSNISPEQLRQAYGDRVYDRCCEMFNFIPLMGKSFRNKN